MIKPTKDWTAIKLLTGQDEEVRESGLIIPATIETALYKGEVVAVGSGYVTESGEVSPMTVKKGDVVLFRAVPTKLEITVEGQTLYMIRERDLLGIIEQ